MKAGIIKTSNIDKLKVEFVNSSNNNAVSYPVARINYVSETSFFFISFPL